MKTSLLWILCVMATLSFGLTAQAQEQRSMYHPFQKDPTAIDLHLGLFTPQGFGGVSVTHSWENDFALSGSAGWGAGGLNVSLMPRLQLLRDWGGFGVGAGPSISQHEGTRRDLVYRKRDYNSKNEYYNYNDVGLFGVLDEQEKSPYSGILNCDYDTSALLFLNAETYVVWQDRYSGLRFSLYSGLAFQFPLGDVLYVPDNPEESPYKVAWYNLLGGSIYAGLAVGYAF